MERLCAALLIALALDSAANADCGTYEQQLAHNHVKQKVKAQLVAPKTADFPFQPTRKLLEYKGGACVVTLKSWVDSKNAFEVEVRKTYLAEVEIRGSRVTITTFGFSN